MRGSIIEAKNLSYTYPDGVKAIDDVSFRIGYGDSVGIVGANGAGKSTLLLLMLGIILPSEGEILVEGLKVEKKNLPEIRQAIGMIFQDPDDQLFMGTVYEDCAFGPRNYGLDEPEVEKRVCAALEAVGISHLKERSPLRLSGGEKRAAAIATALAMNPKILAMDEPTALLDPRSRRRFIGQINALGFIKIIASHDLAMILDTCKKTIVLKNGRIAAAGPTRGLLLDEKLMKDCLLLM